MWLHSSADADWNVIDNLMMPGWPRLLLPTVTFEQVGAQTRLRLTWVPHEASEAEGARFAEAVSGVDLLQELLAEQQG